jgi:hypothetical protein
MATVSQVSGPRRRNHEAATTGFTPIPTAGYKPNEGCANPCRVKAFWHFTDAGKIRWQLIAIGLLR